MRYPARPLAAHAESDRVIGLVPEPARVPRRRSRRLASSPFAFLAAVLMLGAVGVVAPTPVDAGSWTRYAGCDNVTLRTLPWYAGIRKVNLAAGTRVTVVATVYGAKWKVTCGGPTTIDRRWFRISAINGRSVLSLYGVRYLYAPRAQFVSRYTAPSSPPPPSTSVTCDASFTSAPSTTSDQSSAITGFLLANAGKRVCFAPGAVYRVDAKIELSGWTGTIYGRGATFRRYTASTSQSYHIRIVQGHSIVVDGLNITGPATLSDVQNRVFGSGDRQDQAAFSVETTSGFTLRNATIRGTWGDGVDLRPRNASGVDGPTTGVMIENVTMDVIGRNGIGLISVDGATIRSVSINHAALHAIDGEPNRSSDMLRNIVVEGCDLRNFDYGHTPSGEGYAVVLTPANVDVLPTNVVIRNNVMDKGRVRVDGYSSSQPATNISVTGNRPSLAGTAYFEHIRGFTFSDNGLMGISKLDVQ